MAFFAYANFPKVTVRISSAFTKSAIYYPSRNYGDANMMG